MKKSKFNKEGVFMSVHVTGTTRDERLGASHRPAEEGNTGQESAAEGGAHQTGGQDS